MRIFSSMIAASLLASTLSFAPVAIAAPAAQPTLKVCTGNPAFKYFKVGVDLAKNLKGQVDVQPVVTEGSVENLRKLMSGECDAAIAQGDSFLVFSAQNPMTQLKFVDVGPLYPEYPQLTCNKGAEIHTLADLAKKPDTKVAVGPIGSGGETTWEALTLKKPELKKVATTNMDSELAQSAVINGRDAQCVLVVAGLKSYYMNELAELGRDKLALVGIDEPGLLQVKDSAGKPVYTSAAIPSGTYPTLEKSGWFGTKETPDVSISAEFVVSQSWYDANKASYGVVFKTATRLGQQMTARSN